MLFQLDLPRLKWRTTVPSTSLLNYLLTSWCRVLLEKLTGLQLVKKFPAFHGTRRFTTALTSVRHLSLSWANPIQSTYPHFTSWRSSLILSTHLRLGLPSGLFPSGFPTKTLYTPLSSPIRATCPAHLILLDFITRTVLGEEYRSFSSSLTHILVVVHILNFHLRWKFTICTTTNDLTLYSFPHYKLLWPEDGPQWPKHVFSIINTIQSHNGDNARNEYFCHSQTRMFQRQPFCFWVLPQSLSETTTSKINFQDQRHVHHTCTSRVVGSAVNMFSCHTTEHFKPLW